MNRLGHRGSTSEHQRKQNFSFGHCLHSVVGEVKQPLEAKGVVIANCERYTIGKELANKYSLEVGNDAEILLELLDIKGIEALEEL